MSSTKCRCSSDLNCLANIMSKCSHSYRPDIWNFIFCALGLGDKYLQPVFVRHVASSIVIFLQFFRAGHWLPVFRMEGEMISACGPPDYFALRTKLFRDRLRACTRCLHVPWRWLQVLVFLHRMLVNAGKTFSTLPHTHNSGYNMALVYFANCLLQDIEKGLLIGRDTRMRFPLEMLGRYRYMQCKFQSRTWCVVRWWQRPTCDTSGLTVMRHCRSVFNSIAGAPILQYQSFGWEGEKYPSH